jgi:FkbH-like protein
VTLLERRLEWKRLEPSSAEADLRVVLLSSFTVDPLVPYLGTALAAAGFAARIDVGPYGQIAQQCIDPSGQTASSQPDFVVVWPRLEDLWAARPWPLDEPPDDYVGDLLLMVEATTHAVEWGANVIFVLPAVPELRPLGAGDAGNQHGVFATATAAREAARARLAGVPGILVADAEEIVRELGSANALDWRRAAVARIPFKEPALAAMGDRLGRLVSLARRGAAKVAAVDADNTLWGGVVGEDGVDHIDLFDSGPGEAYRDFQRYLLELRRAGLLITIVSKNDPRDVWDAFERPEMVVRRPHLAADRIGWGEKADSIAELAEELNLGIASFVFVDDSGVEREKVRGRLPEVSVLAMPEDASEWFDAIARSGALDRLPPTDADKSRASSYQDEAARRAVREVMSIEDFLASLDLQVGIAEVSEADLQRVAQLIAKTNQFTLNLRRRSPAEIAALLEDDRFIVCAVAASDRFGVYGTIGVFIVDSAPVAANLPPGSAILDTFVLSCRAMGREIETAMLANASARAGSGLWATVEEAPRNHPARAFFARYAGEPGDLSRLDVPTWPAHITATGAGQQPADGVSPMVLDPTG